MRNDNRLLGVLLIAPFMAQVDVTIANVATPAIHNGLHASGAQVQLVIGGYMISFAMLLITGARLGQAYGYRRAFLAGVALFTLASLGCGLAPDPALLIAARVVQGAGAAVMFPQTFTGIQLRFEGQARTAAIASYAMALSGGAVTGQLLGGLLLAANVAGLGWRAVFLVNVPVGAAALVVGHRYLPPDGRAAAPRHQRPDDLPDGGSGVRLGGGPDGGSGVRLDIPGVLTLSAAVLLVPLFGVGGLGLGTQFASLTGVMTAAVPPRYAPDISGVFSTVIQVGGLIAVAGAGAVYLGLTARLRPAHAFALTAWLMFACTVLATIGCFLASRQQPVASKAENTELIRSGR